MGKKLLVAGVVLLAAAAVFYGFSDDSAKEKQKKTPSVQVIIAYSEKLHDSAESLGTALANESIDITANVTETLAEIRFEDGQHVKKGDIIALLAQQEEEAQLQAAKARLAENQRELKRLQTLLQNKAAAQREYDERVTLLEINRQEISEIQARIEDRTLRAPFDGVLGIRRLSVGALVQPSDLITTIDDTSRIKLDFTVPSLYLKSLQPGVAIEARSPEFPETVFKGEIASVNSRIDPVTRSVLVRALIPNPDNLLKPGLLMRVTLLRDEREALVVPEESVIQRQKDHFVLVVTKENVVEERKVQTGMRRPGLVEIATGLQAGEKVIVRGMNTVQTGKKVIIGKTWKKIPAAGEAQETEPQSEKAGADVAS